MDESAPAFALHPAALRRSSRIAAAIQTKLLNQKEKTKAQSKPYRKSQKVTVTESKSESISNPFAQLQQQSPKQNSRRFTQAKQTSSDLYKMFKVNANGTRMVSFISPNSASHTIILKGTLTDGTNVILKCSPLPIDIQYDNSLVIEALIYKVTVADMLYYKQTPHIVRAHDVINCGDFHDFLEILWKENKDEQFARLLRTYDKRIKHDGDYFSNSVIITVLENTSNYTLHDYLAAHVALRNKPEYGARLISILFQIFYTLHVFSNNRLRHNDLHFGNIFVENTTADYFEYVIDANTTYRVPTFGKCAKIYDFDRSFVGYENTALTNDYCNDYGTCNQDNPVYDTFTVFFQLIVIYRSSINSNIDDELRRVVAPLVNPSIWQRVINDTNLFPVNHLMCNVQPDHTCQFQKGIKERSWGFPTALALIQMLPSFQTYRISKATHGAKTFYADELLLNPNPIPPKIFTFSQFRNNPVCEDSWRANGNEFLLSVEERTTLQTTFSGAVQTINKYLVANHIQTEIRVWVEMYDRIAFYVYNIYAQQKREHTAPNYPLEYIVLAATCLSLYNRLRIFDRVKYTPAEIASRKKRQVVAEKNLDRKAEILKKIYKKAVDALCNQFYVKLPVLIKTINYLKNVIREHHVTTTYDYLFNCANIVGDKLSANRIREFLKVCGIYLGVFLKDTKYMHITPLNRARFIVYIIDKNVEPRALKLWLTTPKAKEKEAEEFIAIVKMILVNPEYLEFNIIAPRVTFTQVVPVAWT